MGERTARHRRRTGRDDDLTATARRRLRAAQAPAERASRGPDPFTPEPVAGGWVPQRPAATPTTQPRQPEQSRLSLTRPGGSTRAALADRVPPGLRSAVVAPAGRAVAGLVLLVSLAVLTALVAVWLARPRAEPLPSRPRLVGAPLATSSPAGSASTGSTVLVHVVGAVRRPGVVELPSGSRVADAVEAAGGVSRSGSAASVNLARPAVDGEQVVVARRGDAPLAAAGPPVPGAPTAGGLSAPVDLNAATLEQLDGLPGIGPVLAQRILDWRTENGRFSAVDELGEVSGIGEATLADLRPVVTV